MLQEQLNRELERLLTTVDLLPVVTVDSVDHALSLAEQLLAQGINAIEITLRTEAALAALAPVKEAFPDMLVAAGTVCTAEQMQAVADAGAELALSPAFSASLVEASQSVQLPFMPGVATPSEMLAGAELGLCYFKLFPAVAVGGLQLLKSVAAPLPDFKFCPTGGLTEANYQEFLDLPNVVCVGGSWMVPG